MYVALIRKFTRTAEEGGGGGGLFYWVAAGNPGIANVSCSYVIFCCDSWRHVIVPENNWSIWLMYGIGHIWWLLSGL